MLYYFLLLLFSARLPTTLGGEARRAKEVALEQLPIVLFVIGLFFFPCAMYNMCKYYGSDNGFNKHWYVDYVKELFSVPFGFSHQFGAFAFFLATLPCPICVCVIRCAQGQGFGGYADRRDDLLCCRHSLLQYARRSGGRGRDNAVMRPRWSSDFCFAAYNVLHCLLLCCGHKFQLKCKGGRSGRPAGRPADC